MSELHGWAGASAQRAAGHRGADGRAWAIGAEGEAVVGRAIEAVPGVLVLHDRAVPGSTANIDHVAVAPSGVYVVDAKRYAGAPRAERIGGGRIVRLRVGPHDRSELVAGVRSQLGVVAEALDAADVPLRAVLCFVDAEWPAANANGFLVDDVGVTSPEGLAALLAAPGPLPPDRIALLHARLRARLPAAWDTP